ncbi:RNA polymerase sigma factor [Serinibacter arcticus]|uniref:RNA polymerase sigma-70 factor, ECF subfamily n=1 Tax=Serinibacter arcticus TaxID=1655435 RepID=A0A4Z1E2S2_9MICO|nr:sigma-70 family RNA polymerase sigma factor [Serinibacter arcticus]TGO05519.1 RNA polymerase sigma-70 factor, ECF subfamily [Serinibacter arcticus]
MVTLAGLRAVPHAPDDDGDDRLDAAADVAPRHPIAFDVADAYDSHAREIFGFALNAVRDRGTAEDCVQETFVRAWRARDRFDVTRGGVRTWLFAIARNVVKDSYRRGERIPEPVDDGSFPEVAGAGPTDPVERLAMTQALATLSEEHREAVVAVHLVGVGYPELSERLGVPVATLRTRTFYGLRALRRHLEQQEGTR